ncbi:hypothetical protein PPACK8108_LOCUS23543 [Phakopsora pachyrhizi]|uniref:Uncharacterized protein n=1 Tax=Phakopsora pachyrhizi TaxID=170000 RepID=A0AAV0BQE2_PHAPC|nr:hypothetical protein PPACK8108_LOCUS23543 [Phakopsora pachyrhizi]
MTSFQFPDRSISGNDGKTIEREINLIRIANYLPKVGPTYLDIEKAFELINSTVPVRWSDLGTQTSTFRLVKKECDELNVECLFKLRHSFFCLQEELDPRRLLLSRNDWPSLTAPSAITTVNFIIKSSNTLLSMLSQQPETFDSSAQISVRYESLMSITQDFDRIRSRFLDLLINYANFLGKISVKQSDRSETDHRVSLSEELIRLVGTAIFKVHSLLKGARVQVQGTTAEKIFEPNNSVQLVGDGLVQDLYNMRIELALSEYEISYTRWLQYRHRSLYPKLSREKFDQIRLSLLPSLRDQLLYLRMILHPKNLSLTSDRSRPNWGLIFELPQLITKKIKESIDALQSSFPRRPCFLEPTKSIIVPGVNIYEAGKSVDQFLRDWSESVKFYKEYLITIRFNPRGQANIQLELWSKFERMFTDCFTSISSSIRSITNINRLWIFNDFVLFQLFLNRKIKENIDAVDELTERFDTDDYDGNNHSGIEEEVRDEDNNQHNGISNNTNGNSNDTNGNSNDTNGNINDTNGNSNDTNERPQRHRLRLMKDLKDSEALRFSHEFQGLLYFLERLNYGWGFTSEVDIDRKFKELLGTLIRMREIFKRKVDSQESIEDSDEEEQTEKQIVEQNRSLSLDDLSYELDGEEEDDQVWLKNWIYQLALVAKEGCSSHKRFCKKHLDFSRAGINGPYSIFGKSEVTEESFEFSSDYSS